MKELPIPPEIEYPDEYPHIYQDKKFNINEAPPDGTEVNSALKTFKNCKSAGTKNMKTEGLKYNQSTKLINAIVVLLTLLDGSNSS